MDNEKDIVKPKESRAGEALDTAFLMARAIISAVISFIPLVGYLGAILSAINFSQSVYCEKCYPQQVVIKVAKTISLVSIPIGALSFILAIVLICI